MMIGDSVRSIFEPLIKREKDEEECNKLDGGYERLHIKKEHR